MNTQKFIRSETAYPYKKLFLLHLIVYQFAYCFGLILSSGLYDIIHYEHIWFFFILTLIFPGIIFLRILSSKKVVHYNQHITIPPMTLILDEQSLHASCLEKEYHIAFSDITSMIVCSPLNGPLLSIECITPKVKLLINGFTSKELKTIWEHLQSHTPVYCKKKGSIAFLAKKSSLIIINIIMLYINFGFFIAYKNYFNPTDIISYSALPNPTAAVLFFLFITFVLINIYIESVKRRCIQQALISGQKVSLFKLFLSPLLLFLIVLLALVFFYTSRPIA